MAELRYRGREIREEDILYIRTLIEQYPKESRRKLSVRVCEAWQWRQANGALRDMVCRGMLLMLERAGQITLRKARRLAENCKSLPCRLRHHIVQLLRCRGRCNDRSSQLLHR